MSLIGEKAANERILYMVGKLVVIYFPKLNLQQYYVYHMREVSVVEIAVERQLAASGEMGENP